MSILFKTCVLLIAPVISVYCIPLYSEQVREHANDGSLAILLSLRGINEVSVHHH